MHSLFFLATLTIHGANSAESRALLHAHSPEEISPSDSDSPEEISPSDSDSLEEISLTDTEGELSTDAGKHSNTAVASISQRLRAASVGVLDSLHAFLWQDQDQMPSAAAQPGTRYQMSQPIEMPAEQPGEADTPAEQPSEEPTATPTEQLTEQSRGATTPTEVLPPPTTTTVFGLDGTPYPVEHAAGATIGELHRLLEQRHGLPALDYALHGVADGVGSDAAGESLTDDASLSDYQELFIVACRRSIPRFEPVAAAGDQAGGFSGHRPDIVLSNGRRTAESSVVGGKARFGPWVARAGALLARLRVDNPKRASGGVKISLVTEGAWTALDNVMIINHGWTYATWDGRLFDHSVTPLPSDRWLPANAVTTDTPWRCCVELRAGTLYYTINDAAEVAAFQIPQEGGRVAFAVSPQLLKVTLES